MNPTRASHGMTLVEVLLSLAILSAMASAVVPLLRDSLRSLDRTQGTAAQDLFELSERADQIVDGLKAGPTEEGESDHIPSGNKSTISWPEPHSDRVPVVAHRLSRGEMDRTPKQEKDTGASGVHESGLLGHGWWIFEWRGLSVSRWIPSASEEAQ